MSANKKVSVIMAAYNASKYISDAINSVMAQLYQDWELIVVDDGSTDNTFEIVIDFMQRDFRITYLKTSHRGVCFARNAAIAKASGEWIAILDADDIWLPEKLEKQMIAAEMNHHVVAWGSYVQHLSSTGQILSLQKQGTTSVEEYDKLVAAGEIPFLVHSTLIVKKSVLDSIGVYDPSFPVSQDFELLSRIIFQGIVLAIPEPLVFYRIHKSSASMSKFFTQQKYLRWVLARHRGRIIRNDEGYLPTYNEFLIEEDKKSFVTKIKQALTLFGQFNYRKAGLLIADRSYIWGAWWLLIAIAVNPYYAIPRLWKQRLSPEARLYLRK